MNTEAAISKMDFRKIYSTGDSGFIRITWLFAAVLAGMIFATSLPGYILEYRLSNVNGITQHSHNIMSAIFSIMAFLVSFSLSIILFQRKRQERIGLFVSFYLLAYAIVMAGPLEAWSKFWLQDSQIAINLQAVVMTAPTITLMAIFPNGKFIPTWTRWWVLLSLMWILLAAIFPFTNLFSVPTVFIILFVFFLFTNFIPGLYAQIYRFRYVSSPAERQQTKWVVMALILWGGYIVLSTGPYLYLESLPPESPRPGWEIINNIGWWMSLNILPFSLSIAVLRYRLWDVKIFFNRALVYTALTACIIGIYVLAVGSLGLLFQAQVNWWIALFATGLVAVIFQPLRERLQRVVNRILYGQRDEPIAVLSHLGQRIKDTLTQDMVLPTLVTTISQTLKLPYVAVSLKRGDKFVISESYGKPVDNYIDFPLVYQGKDIGKLLAAPRSPGEEFTETEVSLLSNIALQAGAAVHAIQLNNELKRSRLQLVTALEEERRRIRRDLHDGLGPTLAALMLKTGSARNRLVDNQPQTVQILEEMENDLEDTIRQIRELVYNLRPPALDQLGLVGAIKDYAEQINNSNGLQALNREDSALVIIVTTPESLPPLPAAVEVAAYRIVQESLVNVARHAHAHHCHIELTCDDFLRISITDDGVGLPSDYRTGIGMTSIEERTFELGGFCRFIPSAGGGTQVQAEIPLMV
ncbi:MAG: hypothetical protein IBX69_16860 [Anaerolineales bacterium]|nr:hypothetical protein [Anaerolineales bacterium]